MSLIKGISVTLYDVVETGRDDFNKPIYRETPVVVNNVLVSPLSENEALEIINLTGRKAIYQLGIPKGDTHTWENRKVKFFGKTFRTVGSCIEGIEAMIPLSWNKKIRCEIYNG